MVIPMEQSGDAPSQPDGGGDQIDASNTPDINVDREPNISATATVHSKADFLIAYSTPEGIQYISMTNLRGKGGPCPLPPSDKKYHSHQNNMSISILFPLNLFRRLHL